MTGDTGRPPGHRGASRGGDDRLPKRTVRDEMVRYHVPGVGPVLAVLPVIPDDAPYRIREGIARRRLTAITGECPCGARVDYQCLGVHAPLEVCHEATCPADTARLAKAMRRWVR